MKIFITIILLIAVTFQIHSQDLLILGSGVEIKSKVLEVGLTEIQYKIFSDLDGATISISNKEVVLIKFENGTNQVITNMTSEKNLGSTNSQSNISLKYQGLAPRNSGKALLLSVLLSGGGQYYNRQVGKGVVMTTMGTVGWVMVSYGMAYTITSATASIFSSASYDEEQQRAENIATTGMLLVLSAKLWSVIDAPLNASKINKQYNLSMKMKIDSRADYFAGTNNLIVGPSVIFHF